MEILGYIFGFLLIVFGLFFWGVVLYRTLHSDGDAPLIKTEIEIPEKITFTIHIEKESEESEGGRMGEPTAPAGAMPRSIPRARVWIEGCYLRHLPAPVASQSGFQSDGSSCGWRK